MMPGMRTSSFPGDVEDVVVELDVREAPGGSGAAARVRVAEGYGGRRYAVYANGRRAAAFFVAEPGAGADEGAAGDGGTDAPAAGGLGAGSLGFPARFAEAALALPPEAEDVSVHVEDLGDWADAAYDPDFGALDFEAATARQWTLAWHAPVEIHARGAAAAALSGWALNGLKRFSNCAPSAGGPTRRACAR